MEAASLPYGEDPANEAIAELFILTQRLSVEGLTAIIENFEEYKFNNADESVLYELRIYFADLGEEIASYVLAQLSEEVRLVMAEAVRFVDDKEGVEPSQGVLIDDEHITSPNMDSTKLLMREIGRVPLLGSFEKEKSLALRIERGDMEAKDELIEANLRLVSRIARDYSNPNMSFLDLFQEGTTGLIRAAEKYDWRQGFKFSTYATWWIRQAITRGMADRARTIRLPVHIEERLRKIKTAQRDIQKESGREPTDEQIAESSGLEVKEVIRVKAAARAPVSLELPIGNEEDGVLGQIIEDKNIVSPFEQATKSIRSQELKEALSCLPLKERTVIELRFGINDDKPHTLDDIGAILGVTRERVRQIEKNTLNKLSQLPEAQRLRGLEA
jgi:RNA polymerase primary sigma factor